MTQSVRHAGIDIGSTTAKIVVMEEDRILFSKYVRHLSQVRQKALELLQQAREYLNVPFTAAISGSAGLGLAQSAGVPFVQEVFATAEMVKTFQPDTDAVVELGGEDSKVIFFTGGMDQRMNGTCAGGTGAFIDQMATLLNVSVEELDRLSLESQRIYPIASRCGVFAKTDIQPLINQGARKEDIAASIYQAVVNQTIAGLAQGRRIQGKVLFLGGPLYYCRGLRHCFQQTLQLDDEHAVFPEYGRFAVAMGAAIYGGKSGSCYSFESLYHAIAQSLSAPSRNRLPPLFTSAGEYEAFCRRHNRAAVEERDITDYSGDAWLGIDCGSTTTKLVLLSAQKEILYRYYDSNRGDPVEIIRSQLQRLYELCGSRITIRGSAVTGYGEELIQRAFGVDLGVVETMAHYTAARYFRPQVDFILDIGGQDIKCFHIRNGAIDSIMLNEACSSGCGSFVETFARSMGYTVEEFARKGLFSKAPVNLGSRCTVFMNSSVKQAQKDGASVEDISAGLSISVVKNALYKVIRAGSAQELGSQVVVQGGTFYNDAILRAFEQELGAQVIRPTIAGLMGAYGAALCAMRCKSSTLLTPEQLRKFIHSATSSICQGCTNHCHLTINRFGEGKPYISGNQCQKGLGLPGGEELPDLHQWKREELSRLPSRPGGKRGRIGLPLALGMYELLPLWQSLFTHLDFETVCSGLSTRQTYQLGQFTIPSDTVCYPAKLMHGHVEKLLSQGLDTIFYPCLTYNVDEKQGDNHYNCPVVAYYSELLQGNMPDLEGKRFLYPYLNINQPRQLARELYECLSPLYPDLTQREVRQAVRQAQADYQEYMARLRSKGEEALQYARSHGKRIMILAGRPYHADPEIGHGIDKLAASLGFVVVSEDSICHLTGRQPVRVLNQWTYHARLYRAARYAAEHPDTELVQLVSFGCGVDAITTDEVRSILENAGKFYTQLKIDEITNLGAVKIRLRSLLGALEERDAK